MGVENDKRVGKCKQHFGFLQEVPRQSERRRSSGWDRVTVDPYGSTVCDPLHQFYFSFTGIYSNASMFSMDGRMDG